MIEATIGGRPLVAAITFSPHGGGIAAVSRMVRQALRDAASQPVASLTLATDDRDFETGLARRLAFGLDVGSTQLLHRCDWLFFTHLRLSVVQSMVPRSFARPYGVFLHDVEAWTPLEGPMRRALAGAFVRLANSRYTAERVMAANPGCGPVLACPLAAGPAAAAPAGETQSAIGPSTVVIVGRMVSTDRYKGHDQLIEAWPDVRARVPDSVLMCIGEGDDVARLREKARAAGVGDAVVFPGFVDDATRTAIYRRAACLAMPSRREGFGLVYVEAMAAGAPCIGSIHDAASEVIVDRQTGFLVDQDDRASLVRCIVDLLQDRAMRDRFGAAGFARYRELFTYEAFRSRLIAAVSEALPAALARSRTPPRAAGII